MILARSARSIPAMPIAASSAPIVVGMRLTSSATRVGTSVPETLQGPRESQVAHHVLFRIPGHRPDRYDDDQKGQRETRKHQRQRDFIRRLLADSTLDESYDAVEEGLARKRGYFYHDSIRNHPCTASNSRMVAA